MQYKNQYKVDNHVINASGISQEVIIRMAVRELIEAIPIADIKKLFNVDFVDTSTEDGYAELRLKLSNTESSKEAAFLENRFYENIRQGHSLIETSITI